jgi:DNA-binding transcriptional MerR regulator
MGLDRPPGWWASRGSRPHRLLPEVLERLALIRQAQGGGLTLGQIRQVLQIGDSGDTPCEHVSRVVADRLAEVETRIAEVTATHRHLQALARRAAAQNPSDCTGYCRIITGQ